MTSQVGLIGLGTMGSALARNLVSHGLNVALWNRSPEKVKVFLTEFGQKSFYAATDFRDLVFHLDSPRKIILLLPSGSPTHEVINQLSPYLKTGDVLLDAANAHFLETEKMQKELKSRAIHLLGTGISGGEEGALKGPSLMPGGEKSAWESFRPLLELIAAHDFQGKACVAYMGKGGAGHYVKMVHNGIEYAELQVLSEIYDVFRNLYRLSHEEIAEIFKKWTVGYVSSYLLELTIEVLEKKEDGKDLLDLISDKTGQKGTGQWTSEESLKLGVATPSITNAVYMRMISSESERRKSLSDLYSYSFPVPNLTVSDAADHFYSVLLLTRLSHFEQGFDLLRAADIAYDFQINAAEIARVWQGGCIIRSAILKDIHKIFESAETNPSLYHSEWAKNLWDEHHKKLRFITALCIEHGIPLPGISSTIQHFDSLCRERLSTNLIQGLRDRFGAHGYERVDKEGAFHTKWF